MNWYDPDLTRSYELHAAGDLAGGMAACERLLSRPGLPPEIELLVRRNQTWHARPLARAGQGSFNEPPYWRDRELVVPAYVNGVGHLHDTSFNPSIAEHGGLLLAIVRSANYRIVDGRYVINPERITGSAQTQISTVNHLLELDPETLTMREGQVIIDGDHQGDPSLPVLGHEDCRLFWHDEYGWCYSATVRDHSGPLCMAQMLEAKLETREARVSRSRLLSDQRRHEKNWMPWPWGWGGGSGYVYSVEPTVILDTFFENPRRDTMTRYQGIHLLRHCRGGTQVVPWEGGLSLCLTHEAVEFENGHRVYTHRLVAFDHDGRVAGYSVPFTFRGMGIEFAAGLVLRETEAIISYGVGDERAYLLRLPIEELTGMLHLVDEGERWCA